MRPTGRSYAQPCVAPAARLRIGAVMLSLRYFSTKFQSKHCFLIFFVRWAKILLLKISTLDINLQISEKYL